MAVYEALLLNTVVPQIQAAQAGDSYVMVVNATTPALRITQTGTGNAISVEDETNPDATPFVVSAAGDVGVGVSSPAYKLEVNGGSSDAMSLFNSTNANGAHLRFAASGTVKSYIGGAPGFLGSGTADDLGIRAVGSVLFATNGSSVDMTLDSSGNLGLGVTPSAWESSRRVLQIGSQSAINNSTNNTQLTNNYYADSGGTARYIGTGFAQRYNQDGTGAHAWQIAASGTAGATTSITSGVAYSVTTLGSTTLGEWQAYFSALGSIPSIGQTVTATATGTLAGGATVTQIVVFTQAMTLDASGNFLVGPTSGSDPESLGSPYINVKGAVYALKSSDTSKYVAIGAAGTAGYVIAQSGLDSLRLYAGGSERARITSGGYSLFGQISNGLANINGITLEPGDAQGGAYQIINHKDGTASGQQYVFFGYNATKIGDITQNGTTGVLYNITSDYRLKTVTGAVSGHGERIDALEPVEYTWNADGTSARGFLAHKFQEVYPNSVTGKKDAADAEGKPVYQAMQASTSEVIADLVAELQSLRARVAQLEAK